jgi:GNAT superfamily N-acetyltransferase
MQTVIRTARIEERLSLEDLQRRASLVWESDRAALLAHPEAIALPLEQIVTGRVFVAETEAKVLGFAVVLPRGDGDCELDGLFVEPTLWRQGIGRLLIVEAAQRARAEGAKLLWVIANPNALAFYAACDFRSAGEARTQFGPGMVMCKPLDGFIACGTR